jgi:hypothetical protein
MAGGETGGGVGVDVSGVGSTGGTAFVVVVVVDGIAGESVEMASGPSSAST